MIQTGGLGSIGGGLMGAVGMTGLHEAITRAGEKLGLHRGEPLRAAHLRAIAGVSADLLSEGAGAGVARVVAAKKGCVRRPDCAH